MEFLLDIYTAYDNVEVIDLQIQPQQNSSE